MQSIPASKFVNITPGVLSAGGNAAILSGLLLTQNTRAPIGAVLSFSTAAAVATYFGLSSTEFAYAQVYFAGFANSQAKPSVLKIAQYNVAAVAGYQRGGNVAAAKTLAQVKATAPGPLTVVTDGVSKTTANIDLSGAASLTAAAALIQAALATATSTALCTYDATAGAFVITSPTTGAASTIAITAGAFAAALFLTTATGLATSPGAAAAAAASFLTPLVQIDGNWGSFTTTWEPVDADALGFATWTNASNGQYGFVLWDTDAGALAANNTTCIGYLITLAAYSGTVLVWQPLDLMQQIMVCGFVASVDYTQTNGRATLAYKSQSGMAPGVTDATSGLNLEANGYNYYAATATRSTGFNFFWPGAISGPFKWADSYFGQMWLNAGLQDAGMALETTFRRVPYNAQGYGILEAGFSGPINAGLNAGVIVPNVPLSEAQAAAVNASAGLTISNTLSTRGWYLQVKPATAGVRAARTSPPILFWYMDGQSVQQISMNSVDVQ